VYLYLVNGLCILKSFVEPGFCIKSINKLTFYVEHGLLINEQMVDC